MFSLPFVIFFCCNLLSVFCVEESSPRGENEWDPFSKNKQTNQRIVSHLLSGCRVEELGLQLVAEGQGQLPHLNIAEGENICVSDPFNGREKTSGGEPFSFTFLSSLPAMKAVAEAGGGAPVASPLQTATSSSGLWAANSWPKSCEAVSHTQQWG